MQHLSKLLEIENSELAQLLRFSLYGLEASLKQALTRFPQDPGAKVCDEILRELHSLLEPPPAPVREQSNKTKDSSLEDALEMMSPPDHTPNLMPSGELKLSRLGEVFVSAQDLRSYLGDFRLQSQTDSDLWNEIQRKLLRVPEDLAASWRQRALHLVQEVGAREDTSDLLQLPFLRDEVIYPGLAGTVQTPGLCLSKRTPLYPQIAKGNLDGDLPSLAGLVSICIKFIDIDPDLHHALKSVFSFDVISLSSKPEQRFQYIDALIDRFRRTQNAEENTDPVLTLRAWIDLDEAIHSLVFVPSADRYSWWGNLQQESRRILKKVAERANHAGYDVRLRQLSGLYADVRSFSKDDLPLDCGGTPGEVLACLRVYARIDREEFPGRVLFRSSR